jgi:superkiller protein 3
MISNVRAAKLFLSFTLLISLSFQGTVVRGQDIIAADDISGGGASVFVFRGSRKKPQEKSSSGSNFAARGKAGGHKPRVSYEMAAASRKKRAGTAVAVNRTKRPAAANRRITLSNTLAAKADTQLDAKEFDAAILSYREALKQNPKNAKATDGLSDALTAKGIEAAGASNNQSGAVYLEEAVKLDPKNDIAYAKLGEIYDSQDLTERAIKNYESAVRVNERFTAVYVPLGLDYLKTGDIAKAEVFASKADAEGPESADAKYLRGLVYLKQNKNTEAMAAFNRALELDPQYSSAKYYQAVVYDQMNQGDQSIAAYKNAVAADPDYAPAWFDLGVAYYNKGSYQDAVGAYQEVLKREPNNAQAHANLASTYRQLERYPEANAEYKAAEAGIKTPELYSEWGYCLGKTNEWDKSVARLIAARELSPDAIDYNNVGWGYYNAAQADKAAKNETQEKANLEQSRTALQAAVEKDPKLDAAYMNLGATNNGLGDFQAAVAALQIALSLRNDWVIALNQLGVGYRGLNNFALAAAQFDRVLNLDGNNVLGLFNMGEVQYAMGNKKEAKKYQARLNKINPVLASQLDGIISGKIIIDKAKQKLREKIRIPGIPF